MGIGTILASTTQPYWNRWAILRPSVSPSSDIAYSHFFRENKKYAGNPPPEVHLRMGQVGAILTPICTFQSLSYQSFLLMHDIIVALFCVAFTSYRHIHWLAPIVSSLPFGSGIFFIFTSVFTYLVTAYRPIAASAMAANSALRSSFAAVFPLFAHPMYARLGAPGATALLAGLMTLMVPLP